MSSNGPDVPSAETPSRHPPDHLNLRVTYLHAGNPRPPHNLGAVAASLTVSELKDRLRNELPEHPEPDEQRLIYLGRPLMQNNATLRDALRIEAGPIGPLPYTLHIIIQSRRPQSEPPGAVPPTRALPHPNQASPLNPQGQPNPTSNDQMQPEAAEHARRVQDMAQAHFNMLQQHMAMLNPLHGQLPGQIPQGMHAAVHVNGQPLPTEQAGPPLFMPAPTNVPQYQAMLGEQQRLRGLAGLRGAHHPTPFPSVHAGIGANIPIQPMHEGQMTLPTSVRERVGPNGESIREVTGGQMNVFVAGQGMPNPSDRPASVPMHPATTTAAAGNASQSNMQAPTEPSINLRPPNLPINLPPLNRHLPHPFAIGQQAPQITSTNPLVWLAMSRNGPEALLFAPGHGYFQSSSPQNNHNLNHHFAQHAAAVHAAAVQSAQTTTQSQGLGSPAPLTATPSSQTQETTQHPRPDPAPAQVAVRQPPAGAGPLQQQINAQNENDLFAFIVQRAWLFIRLYMFTFVLSEPGTWRRYLLLTLAIVVCILPRQNPLNDFLIAARRHVDNLVGPPQPTARDQPQPEQQLQRPDRLPRQQQATATTVAPSNRSQPPRERGTVDTTPEETAARLIRQHQDRNPSLIRDALYRIEQSFALFLASLVPGVGERHVRAREEARAADRRREDESRAIAEQGEAPTDIAETQSPPQSNTAEAHGGIITSEPPANEKSDVVAGSSSGVDPIAGGEMSGELRSRGVDTTAGSSSSQ